MGFSPCARFLSSVEVVVKYEVVGGMLAEWTDQCTCGSPVNQGFPHERGCGLEPVAPVEQILADLAELDRLRARVAELEAAGDVLAVEASWTSLDVRCGPLDDAVSDWRAVRGEGSE